ncbi:MAG: hypothetical protein IJ410_03455 [Oscillospiraceae bacterium]|nr:hypothetical protein [Oscillospiraceae bacterium]
MARKLSGNPRIAYEQGKREGYVAGGAEAVEYARHFAVLAIYNIVQNFVKSEKKQNEMQRSCLNGFLSGTMRASSPTRRKTRACPASVVVLAFCEEQNRIYGEEFFGNDDNVLLAAEGVKKIYKQVGFLQEVK